MTTHPLAFVGKSGAFYVLRREGVALGLIKYAKRDSIEQFNNRTGHPEYVDGATAMDDFDYEVSIDPVTLTVVDTNVP